MILGNSSDRSINAIIQAIKSSKVRFLSRDDYSRIKKFLTRMLDLKRNKINIKDEQEFEELFMEMSWVNDHV